MGKKKSNYVEDSLTNALTGLGGPKDRKTHNSWDETVYDSATLTTMYKESWIARKCVDVPADEVVSDWRDLTTPSMTDDQRKEFEAFEKKLKIRKKIASNIKKSRLYGGGVAYIAVEGQNIEEELNIEAIAQGAKINVIVLSRNEVTPVSDKLDTDEFSDGYMRPLFYRINSHNKIVHASRLIIFEGVEPPETVSDANDYWGMPIFDSAFREAIEHCQSTLDYTVAALEQSIVDVISIPDLFAKLTDPQTRAQVTSRIADGVLVKSIYKTLLLDKEEEYNRKEAGSSLSAAKDIVTAIFQVPAGAAGIPVTKFLGISPGGLNATGESDSENYYKMLGDIRENEIEQFVNIVDQVMCMSLFGRTFDDWSYDWKPFWTADKKEEAEINAIRVNELVTLVQNNVMPPSVALRQLFEDGVYSALDEQTVKEIEDLEYEDVNKPEEVVTEPPEEIAKPVDEEIDENEEL